MKRIMIGLSLAVLPFLCGAQSVKPVVEDLPTYREVYNINPLTMDREGRYVRLHRFRADTLAKGAYQNGKKVGPWIYYDREGNVMLSYNYDNGQVEQLSDTPMEKISMAIPNDDGYEAGLVDTPPLYLGYQDQFLHELDLLFEVPELCMRSGLSGPSIASFTVDEEGHMKDILITKTIHPDLEAPIKTALGKIDGRWLPAEREGKKVKSRVTVVFDIQFFESRDPEYENQFVENPGVYVLEKIFVPKTRKQQG